MKDPTPTVYSQGQHLRLLRESGNVSIKDVAGELEIPISSLSRYELGESPVPPELPSAYHAAVQMLTLQRAINTGAITNTNRMRERLQGYKAIIAQWVERNRRGGKQHG